MLVDNTKDAGLASAELAGGGAATSPAGEGIRLPEEARTMPLALPSPRLLAELVRRLDTPPVREGN